MAIANSMIIGHLEGQADVVPIKVRIAEKLPQNSIATTFRFQTSEKPVVKNFKHWYSDIEMIGRHFLLYSEDLVQVKRQYTICNSVIPNVYKSLLDLCAAKTNGEKIEFDTNLLNSDDKNSFHITCKDYHTKKGVSSRLNQMPLERQPNWIAKGPMGMGL